MAAAWRRGWSLLVILDFFGVYSIFGETILGKKQEIVSWGDFSVHIEDVSQLTMVNVLLDNEKSVKSSL